AELGGENRTAKTSGVFAPNTYTGAVTLVFATSGSVQVKVTADDPSLINGAKVVIGGANKAATLFCDSTGIVSASGLALGPINVQVTSANLSVSASAVLSSHSVPLALEVKLGSRATIRGHVEAEEGTGQPSAGTRVLVDVSSSSGGLHLETRTDAAGQWQFTGIPVANTNVAILALGPDDVTLGATASAHIADGTTGIVQMPNLKLDATPPRVVSIDPATNSNSVSPNAQIVITFSEPIADVYVTSAYFSVMATDDGTLVAMRVDPEVVNGQFRVRLTPNALLKSNVVYALTVSDNVHDLTGNKMRAPVGAVFTTVNYTEPKIVRVDPAVELPLPAQSSFRLKFNKPIALGSFDAGNGGSIALEQLDTYKGGRVAVIPFTEFLDANDPSTLVVAPTGVAIQQSSFYRITVGGVRDTQTPFNTQKEPQVFDYFSFDLVKPAVTINSPVPVTLPLVSGVHYTATATVTDEGTTNAAKDVAWVDWFDSDGTNDTFRARVKTAPYNYDFTAPSGTAYTLKASATDLSGNTGALTSSTWTVKANEAPKNVKVVNTPSAVFLHGTFASEVTFEDEGLIASVALQVVGKKGDGSSYTLPPTAIHPGANQQVTRATVDAPWLSARYTIDVPSDAKEGEPLVVTATVTDSVNQSSSVAANVVLNADTANPAIVTMTPAPETHFKFNDTYSIALTGTDAESGISHVAFAYDGKSLDMKFGDAGTSYDSVAKTYAFSPAAIHVPARNSDTRIHVVATVFDYHGNAVTQTNDVIYEGVNDVTVPRASWISPLDGAALPAGNAALSVKLRVKATDDFPSSLKVVFTAPQLANSPVTATQISSGVFETAATLATTADATQMTITATVSDDNPLHDVVLPITIDAVAIDQTIPDKLSITPSVASQYAGKSVLVKGSSAVLYVTTPLTLKNLIVLDGAQVSNPDRVKLEVTITDRLYVDAFSSIDLTSKGYLGAWQRSEDLTFTNSSPRGMTRGDTTTATGALSSAASHAGLGASDGALNSTNATYGSVTDPADFGAGGGGSPACCTVGSNGGGAAAIHAATA
ncbi:MAG: Ig-like domain-containing protein, partial [Acidobacteriota bacterium]